MIGNIGIGAFLVLILGFIYLIVCCIGCAINESMRYFLLATIVYGGFLLLVLLCSRRDVDGITTVAKDDVDYVWLARVLVGTFLTVCSGVSALVLVQYHMSAKLIGKEVDCVHQQKQPLMPKRPPLF